MTPDHGSRQPHPDSTYVRHARADLLVGRFYGRVMPERLRTYLRRSTTPRLRSAVRALLGRALSALSRLTEPARAVPLLLERRSRETIVTWRGRSMLAETVAHLTPVAAKRRNLDLVRDSLSAAEIPHFLVRGSEAVRFRIGVPAEHRIATARALARLADTRAIYVQRLRRPDRPQLASAHAIRRAARDGYFRVTRLQTDPTRCLVLGVGYGCEVELWQRAGDQLLAPRKNPCTDQITAHEPVVDVPESVLSPFSQHGAGPRYPSRESFARPIYSDVTFPIDVVYTWVDGQDPAWQRRRAAAAGGEVYHPYAANSARFISHDELRYSLRSVRMNMPWVRRIYLVTDRQVPWWLDQEAPELRVVDHREIFADPEVLPTFNSHAIETQLHHIPDLAEHFLYLNDDVCIGAPVTPGQFFLANGLTRYFPSPALVPLGEPSDEDIPSSVAGKNNRELIRREFGPLLTHKMKHVPHALRRSVLYEIEDKFGEEHRRTAANRFRHRTDISVPSSLHHYYAFHTGRALPGALAYSYLDLAAPDTPGRLRSLLARRDRQVFCLNDTTVDRSDGQPQRSLLLPFLEAYFPVPSPHELPGATPR